MRLRKAVCLALLLATVLPLSGCRAFDVNFVWNGSGNPTARPSENAAIELATLQPVTPTPAASATPVPKPTAKDADWVLQVDDTQTVTQEETGLVWHFNLYMYLQKQGGTAATGEYTGQIVLKAELDGASLAEFAKEDGLTLDSYSQGYRLETAAAALTVEPYMPAGYAAAMARIAPDKATLQMPSPGETASAMALARIPMTSRMDGTTTSGHDEDGHEDSGWAPMDEREVEAPVVIKIDGASVYVLFPNNPLDREFKGTVTGTIR